MYTGIGHWQVKRELKSLHTGKYAMYSITGTIILFVGKMHILRVCICMLP